MKVAKNNSINLRCDRAYKMASVYVIVMFCSCQTLNCLSSKANFETKIFLIPRLKFIGNGID